MLDEIVVSAARTPQDIKTTPSTVSVISLPEMQREQITDLRTALQTIPGVNVVETGGALGSKSPVLIRGAGSQHTLFLIDGIRMNTEDWTSSYGNFLGASGLAGLERLEVLRGAQSTLYGSAAMGGVISLETARGSGPATGTLSAGGGSFDTFGALAAIAGSGNLRGGEGNGPLSYSFSLGGVSTANDRANNDFDQLNFSTRLEYAISDLFSAGITYRGLTSKYDEPGPTYDATQAGHVDQEVSIFTAYADWHPSTAFASRLTYGWVQNLYDWSDTLFPSNAHSTRNVIDWQNTWQTTEWLQLVAGLNAEWSRYTANNLVANDDLRSFYANVLMQPVRNLEYTIGFRVDDYDTFDTHSTWRTGAAYRIEKTATTFRANYGTGFNAPSPEYVLGGRFYQPSPDLKPEESKGWDAGIEQDLWAGRVTLGATYFHNEFTNKFDFTHYDPLTYLIITGNMTGEATAQGVELSLSARPHDKIHTRIAYTYLSAHDDTGKRLPYSARHMFTGDINVQATQSWLIGAGLTLVAGRPDESYYDSSFNFVTQKMDNFITARLYSSYEIKNGLMLKARIENLFDKNYQPMAGYPGLPLGIFGSIEWRF